MDRGLPLVAANTMSIHQASTIGVITAPLLVGRAQSDARLGGDVGRAPWSPQFVDAQAVSDSRVLVARSGVYAWAQGSVARRSDLDHDDHTPPSELTKPSYCDYILRVRVLNHA